MSESAPRGKIYVAGSSKEIPRVQKWIAAVRAAGYVVTCDWTVPMLEFQAMGREPTAQEATFYANQDADGVIGADYVWVLRPTTASTGLHTELGITIGWNRALERCSVTEERLRVIASGGDERNIFAYLADKIFATDEEAFEHLTNW